MTILRLENLSNMFWIFTFAEAHSKALILNERWHHNGIICDIFNWSIVGLRTLLLVSLEMFCYEFSDKSIVFIFNVFYFYK